MSIIVQKFGGTSVANKERIFNVANIIKKYLVKKNKLVVVVSAQGDTTDELLRLSKEINPSPSNRELDVLLSSGEQISISLLSMALETLDIPCISLTGWQAGIYTCTDYSNARILNVFNDRILKELDNGKIVIVAGFQGINKNEDITTMGRGGSDTTAVAIAASLNAKECQIYTDVDGVYTADPQIVLDAKKIEEISYDNMIRMSNVGAQILNRRSVELAKKYKVEVSVISSMRNEDNFSGTKVREIDDNMIPTVSIDKNIFLIKVDNEVLDEVLEKIDIPILESFNDGKNLLMIVSLEYINRAKELFFDRCEFEGDVSKISIICSNREDNFLNFIKIHNLLKNFNFEIKYSSVHDVISLIVKNEHSEAILNHIHRLFCL